MSSIADVETLQNSGTTAGNNQRRLNHFVRHYEPVVYDDKDLHARHERVRRSADDPSNTNKPSVLHLRFRSHNRYMCHTTCRKVVKSVNSFPVLLQIPMKLYLPEIFSSKCIYANEKKKYRICGAIAIFY